MPQDTLEDRVSKMIAQEIASLKIQGYSKAYISENGPEIEANIRKQLAPQPVPSFTPADVGMGGDIYDRAALSLAIADGLSRQKPDLDPKIVVRMANELRRSRAGQPLADPALEARTRADASRYASMRQKNTRLGRAAESLGIPYDYARTLSEDRVLKAAQPDLAAKLRSVLAKPDQDARPDEIDLMVARHTAYTVANSSQAKDVTAKNRVVVGNLQAPRIAPERLATERAELMGILASDGGIPPANIDDLATRLGRAFAPSELAVLEADWQTEKTLPGLKPSDIQNVQRTIRGMKTMATETKAPGLLSLFQRITAPEPGRDDDFGIDR